MGSQLDQDAIDKMVGFGTTPMFYTTTSSTKDEYPKQTRITQETFPILYANQMFPTMYGLRSIHEVYDPKQNKWVYVFHTEKLMYIGQQV
jgi:hypothetical protein